MQQPSRQPLNGESEEGAFGAVHQLVTMDQLVVYTIMEGHTVHQSWHTMEKYATSQKHVKELLVFSIDNPKEQKHPQFDEFELVFCERDASGMDYPHVDPLVISVIIEPVLMH